MTVATVGRMIEPATSTDGRRYQTDAIYRPGSRDAKVISLGAFLKPGTSASSNGFHSRTDRHRARKP